MTNAEVNERVALRLGWYREDGFWFHTVRRPKPTFLQRLFGLRDILMGWKNPPNFCTSWKRAGPLLEELAGHSECAQEIDGETCTCSYDSGGRAALGDTLPEAISRAWLAWKEVE